ncbi:deleted in malignant brain tumors 1 protein, partial [Biomphalaria glabrata]
GPNMCSVELKDLTESIWHMCSQEYIHLTVICKVDLVNCVPGFKAIISINSIYLNVLDGHNVSDTSQVNQDINITEVGTYSIGCQAQNVKFNDTKISCSYLLQIFGPPLTPPVIQIASTSTYTEEGIQENKVYTVQCKTFGGVPLVNNITVSCGNIESTQSGNIFTSPILFTRFMTGQNCTCTAQHITGCYENNTSTLQLNILYKSAVIEFNVTSNIIENGKSVQFYCEADGNPTPKMFIVKENETIAQNSSGYYLYYNKSMSCRDAGYYFCQTNNGIDVNSEETKQVTVFVRCPLQFTSNEILKNFSLQQGMLFSYKFTVYGYPEPDKITIFKSNQVSNNIIVTNSSLEPPYVTVELKIFRLSLADFGFYTLLIFQNGLLNLSLNFIINEELEANKETDINVGAVVGGCIAACSVVILVVVVVVVNRKYEITCKKKVSNKEPKKTQTYSELSLLQQLKDRHNYETPIHNRNLSNNEVTDKTANYMNVEEMDTMIGNENSLYCNTQNENVHQQITKTVA